MTPAQILIAAGECLYGERWRAPLARDIGVAKRTVERWERETVPCPADIAARLRPLVVARGVAISGLLDHLN